VEQNPYKIVTKLGKELNGFISKQKHKPPILTF